MARSLTGILEILTSVEAVEINSMRSSISTASVAARTFEKEALHQTQSNTGTKYLIVHVFIFL
ncbi:MAG: hypothetical protein AAF519_14980 [Bacteroidota bacterium]